MKRTILFIAILTTTFLAAEWYDDNEVELKPAEKITRPFQAIVVDKDFSPFAGAYDLLFAHHLLTETEDFLFRNQDKTTTAKVWLRFFEQVLFWNPIDVMASVTQHEVFGHGYRARDLGLPVKGYRVSPWGGVTYIDVGDSETVSDLMTVYVGGLEAEAILAQKTKLNWIRTGRIDGRMSALYNQAQQSIFWYTLITNLGNLKGDSISGNDIETYLTILKKSYPKEDYSIGTLTKWVIFNWLDPMTLFSYYSWFYYVAEGEPWEFPMFTLSSGVRYLPNARIGFAPYGPEAYLENFFSINGNPLYLYFKGGDRSAGAGFSYGHFFENKIISLGANLDVWNQGKFETDATIEDLKEDRPIFRPKLLEKQWGAAASVTSTVYVNSYTSLFLEVGGKTRGYLPGYALDKGLVARVGVVIK